MHLQAQFAGVTDLKLEEVPLSYLEEDIDAASYIVGSDIDAIAAMDLADPITSSDDVRMWLPPRKIRNHRSI
jgi:hypothetical protein